MASEQKVVILNGQRYDAATGKLLDDAPTSTSTKTTPPKKHTATATAKLKKPAIGQRIDSIAAPRARIAHSPSAAPRTKTQRSQTLMRTTVKKPKVISVDKRAVTTHTDSVKPHSTQPRSAAIINTRHIMRAQQIARSSLISKFGKLGSSVRTEVLPVNPAPTDISQGLHETPTRSTSLPTALGKHAQYELNPIQNGFKNAASHLEPKLRQESAHHKLAKKLHIHPTTLTAGTLGLGALLIGGTILYSNAPKLVISVASKRTGIHASVPTYSPSGFSLEQPIKYDADQISLNYTSNSDSRNFSVIQKASSWDSKALLENHVKTTGQTYQTLTVGGRTIYVSGGNATWVDGGTWYQIKGDASSLSSDQLLNIVNGL